MNIDNLRLDEAVRHTLDWLLKKHVSPVKGLQHGIQALHTAFPTGLQQQVGDAVAELQHAIKAGRAPAQENRLAMLTWLINYTQEYGDYQGDELGRFPYNRSWQFAHENNCGNLVLSLFEQWLTVFTGGRLKIESAPSRVFVSHDIDSVNGAWIYDGFYALKRGKIDRLLRLIVNQMVGRPDWLNMSRIMDVNDEYGVKSTFFWIVENQKTKVGQRVLKNADYDLGSARMRSVLAEIKNRKFENGLHKSVCHNSLTTELSKLRKHNVEVIANRNHFLKLRIPDHFEDVDQAQLPLDFSLGFAEQYGYRNSYALPFKPYNFRIGQPTNCLFVPLTVMDTTNWTYRKQPMAAMKTEIIDLMDAHRQNALISILWHNNYFTDLKFNGYLEVYKLILDYCRQNRILPITQGEILEKYSQ
ncbi:MAG: polysaccharide deacetylase family protein [Salibacteraceae bacterium]